MSEQELYTHTTKTFAAALNVSERYVKGLVKSGAVRSVLYSRKLRRLEDPLAYQARKIAEAAR